MEAIKDLSEEIIDAVEGSPKTSEEMVAEAKRRWNPKRK